MIDIGNVVAVVAVSFGLGVFWYEFLRRPQKDRLRLTAISFVGVLIGEALVSAGMAGGPIAYGLHPVTALVASFAAVYLNTAWVEKKVWPWEIIDELNTVTGSIKGSVQGPIKDSIKSSIKSVPTVKFTLGSSENESESSTPVQPEVQVKKAA